MSMSLIYTDVVNRAALDLLPTLIICEAVQRLHSHIYWFHVNLSHKICVERSESLALPLYDRTSPTETVDYIAQPTFVSPALL